MGFQFAINDRFKIGVNGGRGDECVQMMEHRNRGKDNG